MESFLGRFRAIHAELAARPDVRVTRLHVSPPASERDVAQVERALGLRLPEALRAFYLEANGCALQWFPAGTDGADGFRGTVTAPFEGVPEDGTQSGVINLGPVEGLLEDHEDEFWFADMTDEPADFLHDELPELPELAFHRSLRAFDYFDAFRVVCIALADRPRLRLVFGDDYGADFVTFSPVPVQDYLDAVLATYGSYRQRVLRFFSYPPRERPVPDLDAIIAECREEEEDWHERIEAEFQDDDEDEDWDEEEGWDEE